MVEVIFGKRRTVLNIDLYVLFKYKANKSFYRAGFSFFFSVFCSRLQLKQVFYQTLKRYSGGRSLTTQCVRKGMICHSSFGKPDEALWRNKNKKTKFILVDLNYKYGRLINTHRFSNVWTGSGCFIRSVFMWGFNRAKWETVPHTTDTKRCLQSRPCTYLALIPCVF